MDYKEYFDSFNVKTLRMHLVNAIKEQFRQRGFIRAVVGLSGGLDSSVVLMLATEALGPDNVHAFFMPYKTSSGRSAEDAKAMAELANVHFETINITEQIDAYFRQAGDMEKLRIGNKCARERMSILYDQSSKLGALVLGTGNRSEIIMGYSTVFGDTACAVNPLGNLYKTIVRKLAAELSVPEQIISKPPSADLWEGQTDEKEMNVLYKDIDAVSYMFFDCGMTLEEIEEQGFSEEMVNRIIARYRATRYKYEMPYIIPLNE